MSTLYDKYIQEHKAYVATAFAWIRDHMPDIFKPEFQGAYEWNACYDHDESKYLTEEYEAYDNYFYGNKSYDTVKKFEYAWLHHIHNNPHHWQYWILFEDDPEAGKPYKVLDMKDPYIVEMICDWMAMSYFKGDIMEVFSWYEDHKDTMILSDATRKRVEYILDRIKTEMTKETQSE